ncbi:hypothetical protein niasHS_016860 [Heterodera schachtii]|uniref:DDE-1 domain-containing protein n=2 Tax=Heterodera TaxID=34509 RepID=A0ABD2HYN0_HETSC
MLFNSSKMTVSFRDRNFEKSLYLYLYFPIGLYLYFLYKSTGKYRFAATATILVLVRTNAGSAQNLAMRLHHAHLHMTPKRDSAQKSHAVCAGSTMTLTKAQVPPFQQNQSATKTTKHCHSSSLNKLLRTTTTTSTTLQKNTCFVMVWQNMDGQRLDDGIFGNFHFGARLLVWDSFRCHISEDTKKTLRRLALHSAVIPGGTTKYIQAPDVCWNAPFKEAIRKLYNDWMTHGEKATTSGGNLKAPPMDLPGMDCQRMGLASKANDCRLFFDPDGAIPNGLALLKQHRQEEEVLKMVEEIDLGEDESDEEIDVEVS